MRSGSVDDRSSVRFSVIATSRPGDHRDARRGSAPDGPSADDFDDLPPDADEPTRQDMAERLVPYIRAIYQAHPGLLEARTDAPGGVRFADETIADAMSELYNSEQLDVLRRAREILRATA